MITAAVKTTIAREGSPDVLTREQSLQKQREVEYAKNTLPPDLSECLKLRWTPSVKQLVAAAVHHGRLARADALSRYRMLSAEIDWWIAVLQTSGAAGLRTTKYQVYQHRIPLLNFAELCEVSYETPLELGNTICTPVFPSGNEVRSVLRGCNGMVITALEHAVVRPLVHFRGTVVTNEMLLMSHQHLFCGERPPRRGIFNVAVCNLRKKLTTHCTGVAIHTIHGRGYIIL